MNLAETRPPGESKNCLTFSREGGSAGAVNEIGATAGWGKLDNVSAMAMKAVQQHHLAGLAVAVIRPGQPPETFCTGEADIGGGREMGSDTVFRIASITKTMTAIGLMQLYEAGLFQLEDAVNDFLRTFRVEPRSGGPPITFWHLLTHTSGIGQIPSMADILRPQAWGMDKAGSQGADLKELYRGVLRTHVPAGTKWAYANHGFAVIGQLVQDISGIALPQYMRENVFDPLRMTSTDYLRSHRTARASALGYQRAKDSLRPVRDYDRSLLGPGAVRSTLSDMVRYAQALLQHGVGEDGQVLRPRTLSEMFSPQFSPDPRIPGMGLAFFLHTLGEHHLVGHDGNLPGFASALLLAPDDGFGVIVLTNTATPFGAHLLAEEIMRSELRVTYPIPLSRIQVRDQSPVWNHIVGYYRPRRGLLTNVRDWQLIGPEAQVVVKHGRLFLRCLSPHGGLRAGVPLQATNNDDPLSFEVNIGGMVVPIVFQRVDTRSVTAMCIGHPLLSTLHKKAAWRSVQRRLIFTGAAALTMGTCRAARRKRYVRAVCEEVSPLELLDLDCQM
jgi:CubicO group peptidase (beta-lactamase class C family)